MSEFTKDIPDTKRIGTEFETMDNHDETYAKGKDAMACHHCRYFSGGCDEYIGQWHKTCNQFQWW